MSGPASHLDTAITLEEVERQDAVPAAPDLTKITIDGDGVSSLIKGKSVADVVKQVSALEESLRTSESARRQAELTAQTALRSPVPEAPKVEEPKDMTREEFDALYQNDPMTAISALNDQAIRRAERNLETRLGPIVTGGVTAAENQARSKYADEFQLFGTEIKQIMEGMPNARTVFSNPAAWDDLISLVRGRPGNFERLLQHKATPSAEAARIAAISRETAAVGFSDTGSARRANPTSVGQLDATQREIAEKIGLTPEEYIKWSNVNA